MAGTIYLGGTATLQLNAGDKVAVASTDIVKIYRIVTSAHQPPDETLVKATQVGENYTSSAFSSATQIRIQAFAAPVSYDTGASPSIPTLDSINAQIIVINDEIDTINAELAGIGAGDSITGIAAPTPTSNGGNATATGGIGGATSGVGGSVNITGGVTPSTLASGGAVNINGGTSAGGGGLSGGWINITGGNGTTANTSGGNVILSGGAKGGVGAGVDGIVCTRSRTLGNQPAPVSKTTSATLTTADIFNVGLITVNQGAGATCTLTLPQASFIGDLMASSTLGANDFFDFIVINTSTVAAENAVIVTNTNWTALVGDMNIAANSATTTKSSARFRAVTTNTVNWTLYRIS